ncbi:MAG: Ig-like domain-containing protein [Firmicutes bacterium]|nr:Ig-like domain-containing protein [Bacillota bacterium]
MFRKRILCMLAAVVCLAGLCLSAAALEVDSGSTYCFSIGDFQAEETLSGICITGLPDPDAGTVMLGSRVIRTGDILTAGQVAQMTFLPLDTQTDQTASVTYLPIYESRVAPSATMTISIRGKQNLAPVAEDSSLETYKNLPNEGQLKVSDPEGGALVYTLVRQPKRGEVILREDGSFLYTPKKNKVGVDSFTYTATDAEGNVSREATVTIQILKPTDASTYTDTVGTTCRFAAEWMKNTGIFVGEQIGGAYCFQPDAAVTKGEFLTMMVKTLGIPVDADAEYSGYTDEAPQWLRPYLAAAMRAGLTAGLPVSETGALGVNEPVTGAEAAVMLHNAMDLPVTTSSMAEDTGEEITPEWAQVAVAAMQANGIQVDAVQALTRGQVAVMLYQASLLASEAPGLALYQ